MLYHLLVDLVMLLHFGFILFAVLGALLVVKWPKLIWLHIPVALWAMGIEFYGGICPLTPLENELRIRAGEEGYSGGFVANYIGAIIYPGEITPMMGVILGSAVLIVNIVLYAWVFKRRRDRLSDN